MNEVFYYQNERLLDIESAKHRVFFALHNPFLCSAVNDTQKNPN